MANISFQNNLDVLLLEPPMRYFPMMPNGLGYVYNSLKPLGIKIQAVDLNIHYFLERNQHQLWDTVSAFKYWTQLEWVKQNFWREINEVSDAIIQARPKIVGFSISQTSDRFAKEVVARIRPLPETIIIVGGYDCYYANSGPSNFPDFDYMCIGEADLTLPPLIKHLLTGWHPQDVLGFISKHDNPARHWVSSYWPKDIDALEFPKYEWTDGLPYENLVPLMMSRGCPWGRCHFCSERFPFRVRNPLKVIKEIEWHVIHGYTNFLFGDSCLNSDLWTLTSFCQELIKQRDHLLEVGAYLYGVAFSGQFHVSKHGTRELFTLMRSAGCQSLTFGVDGWTDKLARLQNKGYTFSMVEENLRNCHEVGIATNVNMVIGVPGETEADVDEAIENIIRCKPYITLFQNFNTLILGYGSDYYQWPGKYGIKFTESAIELYRRHPTAIPVDSWFSTAPYIDGEVRKARLQRIYSRLSEAGIPIGDYAKWQVKRYAA